MGEARPGAAGPRRVGHARGANVTEGGKLFGFGQATAGRGASFARQCLEALPLAVVQPLAFILGRLAIGGALATVHAIAVNRLGTARSENRGAGTYAGDSEESCGRGDADAGLHGDHGRCLSKSWSLP